MPESPKTIVPEYEPSKYNGWSNWETWNCALWLDNDRFTYDHFVARSINWKKAESTSEFWTQEQSARINLAEEIQEYMSENNPLGADASVYVDLLTSAIDNIDFKEIAQSKLDELE